MCFPFKYKENPLNFLKKKKKAKRNKNQPLLYEEFIGSSQMPECSIMTSSPFLSTLAASLSSAKRSLYPRQDIRMTAAPGCPPGGRTGLHSGLQAGVSELYPDPASQSLGGSISQSVGS